MQHQNPQKTKQCFSVLLLTIIELASEISKLLLLCYVLHIHLLTLRLRYARVVHFRVFCKEYCNLDAAILFDIFSKILSLRFNLCLHSSNFKKNLQSITSWVQYNGTMGKKIIKWSSLGVGRCPRSV